MSAPLLFENVQAQKRSIEFCVGFCANNNENKQDTHNTMQTHAHCSNTGERGRVQDLIYVRLIFVNKSLLKHFGYYTPSVSTVIPSAVFRYLSSCWVTFVKFWIYLFIQSTQDFGWKFRNLQKIEIFFKLLVGVNKKML